MEERDDNPKAEKEELEINTALAAADTKLEILQKYERSNAAQSDGAYSEQHENQPVVLRESQGEPASYIASQHENTSQHFSVSPFSSPAPPIHSAMVGAEKPTLLQVAVPKASLHNDITEFLVKQQKLSTLPPQNIPAL